MAPDKRSGFLDFIKIIKWNLSFCSQEMWFSASSCDPGKLTVVPPVYRKFPTLPEDLGTNRLQSHWRQLPIVLCEGIPQIWIGLDASHVI